MVGVGGGGERDAGWRWQGQEEGAAQRKTEGAKQNGAKQTFLSLLISYSSVFHPQKEAGFC